MRQDAQYNARQYRRMLATIEDYEAGRISPNTIRVDVEALIRVLEDIPRETRSRLCSAWSPLEVTYALLLDNGKTSLDDRDVRNVAECLVRLKQAVRELLGDG